MYSKMRTPEQDREWLLKMAAAEDEALAGCGGVLACSPEIYRELQAACAVADDWIGKRNTITVSVPTDVVEQVKNAG